MRNRAFLVTAGVLFAATPASAADHYVDASAGNDANVGSAAAPFATVQAGLSAAQPGDTVIVRSGTYAEAPQTVRDGTAGEPITLRADESGGAVVTAPGDVLTVRHAHHVVDGLVIDGQLGAGRALRLRDASDHIVLRNLEVHHSGNNCVDIAQSTDVLIEKSSIHHCLLWADGAPADAHGITGDAVTDLTVRDVEIFYVSGDAIQLSPAHLFWDNILVERTVMWTGPLPEAEGTFLKGVVYGENAFDSKTPANGPRSRAVFRDVVAYGFKGNITNQAAFNIKENVDFTLDRGTIYGSEIAFRMRGPALATVRNAVTHGNDVAVRYEDAIADLTFQNVTFADPIADGGGGAPTGMSFRNALFVGTSVPPEAASDPSNLAADEGFFVDLAGNDFHLVEDAKAADAGITLPDVTTDRDGVPRPFGAGYDVGAYEWTDMPIGTGGSGAATGSGGHGASAGGGGGGGGNGGDGNRSSEDAAGCGCRTVARSDDVVSLYVWAAIVTLWSRRRRTRETKGRPSSA